MSDHVRWDEYVSGGYCIVQAVPREDWLGEGLLPEMILSASGCRCSSIPDSWAIRWTSMTDEGRLEDAAEFGLDGDGLEALMTWTDAAWADERLRWSNVLASPAVAREVVERFVPDCPDLHLIGLGLARPRAEQFPVAPPEMCETGQCCKRGLPGVYETLALRQPLVEGGQPLGFELLGYSHDATPPCSWLCNSLHQPVAKALDIKPNAAGFIDTEADAQKVADYCNRDDVPSEPVTWHPWLIVEYPP